MNPTLTLILGCLALTANAHAHGGASGKDGRQPATPADLLAKFDKNGDGMLDATELAALTSEERASLGQHGQHHGHPGRGKGGPGPGGRGVGRGAEAGRGKDAPGGKGGPAGKGDGPAVDAGRGKDGPAGKGDGRGADAGRGNAGGRAKGKAN